MNIKKNKSDMFENNLKIFIIILWKGGYPHEILSFLLSKAFQESTDSSIKWPPKRIVEQASNALFIELCDAIENDCNFLKQSKNFVGSFNFEDTVAVCFNILRCKLGKKLSSIIKQKDYKTQKRLKDILELPIGLTCFNHYYSQNPENNIADWTYNVKKNITNVIIEERWLERPYNELLNEVVKSLL